MKNLVLLGAGGHCKSTIEIIESLKDRYCIKGILDKTENGFVLGYPILGNDALIDQLAKDNEFVITVGSIKSTTVREKLAQIVRNSNGRLEPVISKHAIVSKHSTIKEGTVVFNFAHVNANCIIGQNCILNTACNIEHDCIIGDFTHISTGAIINGDCQIGNSSFIGSGAVIANGVTIAQKVIIGAGSVVIRNITESGLYVGNPARKVDMEYVGGK